MEAVAEKIIRALIDMTKDLRFRLQSNDGGAGKEAIHLLRKLCHESQRSWKAFRHWREKRLLVFVEI